MVQFITFLARRPSSLVSQAAGRCFAEWPVSAAKETDLNVVLLPRKEYSCTLKAKPHSVSTS